MGNYSLSTSITDLECLVFKHPLALHERAGVLHLMWFASLRCARTCTRAFVRPCVHACVHALVRHLIGGDPAPSWVQDASRSV